MDIENIIFKTFLIRYIILEEETRPTILKEVYLYRIFKDIHNIALCYFASYFILTLEEKRLPIIGSHFIVWI